MKKIYDSVLAGFLNLTNGDGGSNALSQDQSSFFLKTIQKDVDLFIHRMNLCIAELCRKNKLKTTPVLNVSDIGSISMDEYSKSMSEAKNSGILGTWSSKDVKKVREQMRMPEEDKSDAVEEPDAAKETDNAKTDNAEKKPKKQGL